jgi:hypothetical protein
MLCGNNLSIIALLILSNSSEVIKKTEFFFHKADRHALDSDITDVFITVDNFVIRQWKGFPQCPVHVGRGDENL